MEQEQSSTIEEILDALEASIKDVHTMTEKKEAAVHIAFGIIYGNNAVNARQFFCEYPELETIAELALDLDQETNEEYSNEYWNGIVNRIRAICS